MSKHAIEQDIESIYETGSALQREIVLKYATAPSLIGTLVALGATEGWIPTGLSGRITDAIGWAFAVITVLGGWWAARKRVTPAAAVLAPTDSDGQKLVPETAHAQAPGAGNTQLSDALAALDKLTAK